MTTLIIGAHGQVGQHIVKQLAATGKTVYGGIRNAEQADTITQLGGQPRTIDLLGTAEDMVPAMAGVDTVVFAAGSGGSTGDDMTLNIDLDGAVKAMHATELADIKRFILISALGTDDRAFWNQSGIRPYYVAKYYADQWLRHRTDLDYTILRPGALTNDAPTGQISLDPATSDTKKITRRDVAAAVVAVVKHPQPKQIIELVNGNTPVAEALR
ncbi:SDR family oxidoreductase [Levilactobacillus brevis]|uniref:SDR family oxidoreductase n=1 Tax=Levilactobacillus brevis TaxID=1580 RepID=UPI00063AB215|nr:SDR family oxidoreductase [Levilactobacillus brevis]KLE29528.1 short-chain dehydrogenase [Levilactobacillus brevis]MBX6948485.1 SDR family oxidoreductase [Levilactobacillus brevis]MCT3569293.1 SDR family oxidoreductase [Levilactobacillus brevis]MCT3578876.1 SDR family oxidoreductase [Levilactobacillus brevis]PTV22217.1 SDR family NAD(P)-dependent oxidoreductase [Levilactobacillus brevis]